MGVCVGLAAAGRWLGFCGAMVEGVDVASSMLQDFDGLASGNPAAAITDDEGDRGLALASALDFLGSS